MFGVNCISHTLSNKTQNRRLFKTSDFPLSTPLSRLFTIPKNLISSDYATLQNACSTCLPALEHKLIVNLRKIKMVSRHLKIQKALVVDRHNFH